MKVKGTDVIEYLATKGKNPIKVVGNEAIYKCFLKGCDDRTGHLYVNKETSQYNCKICDQSGGIFTLKKCFGDNNGAKNKSKLQYLLQKIRDNDKTQCIQYLVSRCISEECASSYQRQLYFSNHAKYPKAIIFPIYRDGEIISLNFKPLEGSKATFLGNHEMKGGHWPDVQNLKKKCILVESPINALTLLQCPYFKNEYTILSSLSSSNIPAILRNFDEIHIFIDNDPSSIKWAQKIKNKYPGKIVSRNEWVDDKPAGYDINDLAKELKNPQKIESALQKLSFIKLEAEKVIVEYHWDEPICFDTKIVPPGFPLEALPLVITKYIQSVAKNRQVPVDLPAMLALGVINAAAAKKFKVYIGDTHNEPLNLYPVTALEPGSRKTDTFKDMVCPLIKEEQSLLEEKTPGIEQEKIKRELEEARLKQLKAVAAKIEDSIERELREAEIVELNANLTAIPNTPRLLAGADSTAETVATYLYENQGRLAIIDAEGGGLFSMIAGRYAKESNLEVYLKGHSGDEIRVGRKGRPDEYIHEPALSIIITVQPDVIQSLAGNSSFRSRGLLGRFLYSVPNSLVGERVYKNIALNSRAQDDYIKVIQRILQYPWDKDDDGYKLIIKGDALEIWAAYADEVEKAQVEGGELYGIRDWASKLAGAVARIAGGLHLIQGHDGAPWMNPISTETIAAAWAIGFYLKEHALLAFDLMDANTEISFARSIWKWIKKNEKTIFTLGDYYRHNRTKANKPEDLLTYFHLLVSRNFIRQIKDEKHGVGPRAKYLFELNPKCLNCQECIQEVPN